MRWQGKSVWLASVCLAAALDLCLCGPAARAEEASLVAADAPAPRPRPLIDMAPTGAVKKAPAASGGDVSAASAPQSADQAAMPFEPELPPDATDEQSPLPVPAIAVTAIAAAPPSLEKPRGDWPVAKSIGGPAPAPASAAAQPGDLRSTGASPGDVEAAVEAMLKADVRPQAPGAR
jgi:hypothetical protein